ncbi:uncharacterized protein LOC113862308 [Abrus precatorius]|uniref:Uncharacterized protein LOC113862308 n=1 Tax=Abrus precatorius TaxID=3816 RepID=A0A8B8L8Y1_ABRPR|nr:uncharacterized protein LOC113862308 [Abrus precatorius]
MQPSQSTLRKRAWLVDTVGLLNRFLGPVARDFQLFPINYTSWKKVPKDYKEYVFNHTIQELESGRKVSRGEVWTITYKHANGHFVSQEAKEISEKIQEYESSRSLSQEISTQDSLAHVLESKEHYGRVRGLGLGPCLSQVFGYPARSYSGMSSSLPSYGELQNQVTVLKSQMDEQNKKFDVMMNFFIQNFQGQLPPDLAIFQSSLVSNQGSAQPTNVTDHSSSNSPAKEWFS